MMYSNELLPVPDGPMIETASPLLSKNETFDKTRSGPLGVGYSLETLSTLSTNFLVCFRRGRYGAVLIGGRAYYSFVSLECTVGHARNTVELPNFYKSRFT